MSIAHRLAWASGALLLAASGTLAAQGLPPSVTTLQVQAQPGAPDLPCTMPARPKRSPGPVSPEPAEWPDAAEVQRQVLAYAGAAPKAPATDPASDHSGALAAALGRRALLRVGIWGDSHLAAGFFTQELQRLSQLPAAQVRSRWAPASLSRPGVRLPLRRSCVSPEWQYESAHAQAAGAALPGPGLVNMLSRQDGAWLALDMRDAAGQAVHTELRLLYQQTAQPMVLSLRVDGAQAQEVWLQGPAGPAVLSLVSPQALSTVALQVLRGPFRLHGLEWPVPPSVRLQMDVFGYPGATVAGWRQVQAADVMHWWTRPPYDLVVLAFGTNEGNVQPFHAQAYRQTLQAAVGRWREVFPNTACLLVAPGDRGVWMRRSDGKRQGGTGSAGQGRPDVLRFTRVHEEIGQIQKEVAQAHGCLAWSMLEAMGGAGSAYRWARHDPPWMAKDLIHFTVAGYQRLAQLMAKDLGWGPSLFQVPDAVTGQTSD